MPSPTQPAGYHPAVGEPPPSDLVRGMVTIVARTGGSAGTSTGPPPTTRAARLDRVLGRTLVGPALAASVALAGLALLNQVDPNEAGHYPSCPFLALSGLFCPGCGSMRMLHHLTDGDVVEAFWMNPLGFVLLPALLAYWGQWTYRVATGSPRGTPLAAGVVWAFLAVVVAYWVLRNLPALAFLAPL
ncbi:DUF2752 domain-containing protein [Aquipuribacter sp. MA13-6]|uniref:DUF2752 domain-containing protein n=1 Tax=unclassified Aquipuribacter TaxID=2635084 RepID=UPI003EECDA47